MSSKQRRLAYHRVYKILAPLEVEIVRDPMHSRFAVNHGLYVFDRQSVLKVAACVIRDEGVSVEIDTGLKIDNRRPLHIYYIGQ